MDNAEKSYAERQRECGIQKGDLVRVVRKALSYENDWPYPWVSKMDEMVGNIYAVKGVYNDAIGLLYLNCFYYFPYFVLEKVVNMNAKEKSYTERQAECGLKIGDNVRVVRSALDNENGWSCPWVSEMDVMVGNVYKVEIICARGICLRHPNNGTWYHFPYFVLKKVVSMGAAEKAYTERQEKCGIHKGDIVRVVRGALPYEKDWPCTWLPGMDKMIGNIYEVGNVSSSGICLLHPNHITFCFPYFVLKKLNSESTPKKSYAERQAECGIKIGDTVRVLYAVDDQEDGWPGYWIPEMDKMVGCDFPVQELTEDGIAIKDPDSQYNYCFPYFVLKKLTSENTNKSDTPLSPHHYSRWAIEPWDFISENKLDFLTGNVIKYIMRHDEKNGLEDLQKAKVYLEKLIEVNSHAK